MKTIVCILSVFLPLFILANTGEDYIQKIKNANSQKEKEELYLNWVKELNQSNTASCDTLIQNAANYVPEFSNNGQLTLIVFHFNNLRLAGTLEPPNIKKYKLDYINQLLFEGMAKCFKNEQVSPLIYKKLQSKYGGFNNPIRKSLFYAIASCLEGIDEQKKIEFFEKAIAQGKKSTAKTMVSALYDILSNYYEEKEDFESALLTQQKGISFAQENNLKANTLQHLINTGEIHFNLENITEAKKTFLKAKNISDSLHLDYISGKLHNHLGDLYSYENNLKQSIYHYQQSLLKFYDINNLQGLAFTHKNIGNAYFHNEDLDLAEKNYQLSAQFYKDLNLLQKQGKLFYLTSELHLAKNELIEAEIDIQKATTIWKKKNKQIALNKAFLLYGKIKKAQGFPTQANIYFEKYIAFNDSVHQLEIQEKVAELNALFQTEQRDRKIAEQDKKLKEEATERLLIQSELEHSRQRNHLVIIILVISLILSIAIFSIIRNKNKQEQLKKKQKETELRQTLLRAQMNPHFIFNALSVIQSYIYDEDTINSSKFLVHFSKLMRLILENNTKEFIALDKELEIIERYLVIQKIRFENRFDFLIEDNVFQDHKGVYVPPMFVQPFIENAIEHGDLHKVNNGLIRIQCEIQESLFIFIIEDNGIGRAAAQQKKRSNHLKNHRSMAIDLTKERIDLLNEKHKSKGKVIIEDLDKENKTGTRIKISIPFIKEF